MMDTFFFWLSKLTWMLLQPGNFLVFLLLLGLIVYRWRRKLASFLIISSTLMFTVIIFYPVGHSLMLPLEDRFPRSETLPQQIAGIIVLGGSENLVVSKYRGLSEVESSADRLISAVILAKKYPDAPIVYMGGSGSIRWQNKGSEADVALSILQQLGVDKNRFIVDSLSRNTYENFRNIAPSLADKKGKYLLITSAFHMPRSVGIARKFNINVIPYPVDYKALPAEYRYIQPEFGNFTVLSIAIHEWLGLMVYYFSDKIDHFFPKPS